MSTKIPPLRVAVSSRALFNLDDAHSIYQASGLSAYEAYLAEFENKLLRPGVMFPLIRKLLALNTPGEEDKVSVMILSRNTVAAGARIMNSVMHYGLPVERAVFTSGGDQVALARAADVNLFLSSNVLDVHRALAVGVPAACVETKSVIEKSEASAELCIAFDADAVLFSDEGERLTQAVGIRRFQEQEHQMATIPLPDGPFRPVLEALCAIQAMYPDPDNCPVRTALVTARGLPAYARVINTLRGWDVRVNEALFLGGKLKGEFLSVLQADLFCDDSYPQIESARQYVPTAHVPLGIKGEIRLEGLLPSTN